MKKGNSIVAGLTWSFGERIFAQGITFLVSVILARILTPTDYGLVALVLVFINLANVFVTNGFGESLIQKKNANMEDFSTVFWCALVFSVLLYGLVYFAAPYLGLLCGNIQIVPILRVFAIKIPLSSLNTVQRAYVVRNLQFKKFFFSTIGGTLISGVVGVFMAIQGYGAWAVVAQYLVNSTVDTAVLSVTSGWHPKYVFNGRVARRLVRYSWKITGAAFINELYSEIRSLIIGRVYSPLDLAFYNRGNQFPSLFITNINASINSVFFPVMSKLQDETEKLKALSKRALSVSTYVIFPMLFGLMGIAENLVEVLLTEKWLPCVPYLRILCLYWMVQPMQSINWQIMKAIGRSDLCLKLEIIKKIIGFLLIALTMFISVEALAWSTVIFAMISMFINMSPNKKLIGFSISEQIKDIMGNMFLSSSMGILVWIVGRVVSIPVIHVLFLQVLVGASYYISASILTKSSAYCFLLQQIKRIKSNG